MGSYNVDVLETLETTHISTGSLHRCSDGVVEIRFHKGMRIGIEEIEELLEAQLSMTPAMASVLVDARNVVSMTREAQERTADNPVNDRTAATAILVGNPVSALLGNFFIRFGRPPYPARVFRKEEEARAWLLEHLAKHSND